jgi:short-subunit dehydrogenase
MSNLESRPLAAITGASCGIGFELARELSNRGYDLIIAAEDDGISDAARALEQSGALVTAVQVDLANYDGVEKLYSEIEALGRPLDVVAINAGVGVGGDFARETDLRAEVNLINLNVTSAVHLAKRVLPGMAERKQGRVLFTSSIAGVAPGPFEAVYAASKAFLFSFSEALRNELKDSGVTVTALMPGATETNFFHRAGMDDTKVGQSEKDDPAEVAREGVDALLAGRDRVVAGSFKNKLFATAGRLMPETAAGMHRKQTEPAETKAEEPIQ